MVRTRCEQSGVELAGPRDSSAAVITDRPSLELSSGEGLRTARRVRGAVGGLAWFACPANAGGTRTQSRSSAGLCVLPSIASSILIRLAWGRRFQKDNAFQAREG